jgi:ISXO2 transposase-like protein/transposase-like zinc ribbon protein
MARRPKPIHQLTAADFERMFPDEEACCAYLVGRRWPKGVKCPRCGADVSELKGNPWHWQCYNCAPQTSYRFSHIAGTIFENTNKPLRQWFKVIHLMLTSKKGMSALQITRYMGFGSYKTAWLMCHKVRTALVEKNMDKLGGVVEVDETYIGGHDKNRHWDKKSGTQGRGYDPLKTPVVGAVRRKGNVVARVVLGTDRTTVEEFVHEVVSDKVSLLCTDNYQGYGRMHYRYPHGVVDHSKGEHVIGAIHTNTIEGFWSLIKRGIVGSYHKVSRKYLPLYVAEFQFRYNNRMNPDIFGTAIGGC